MRARGGRLFVLGVGGGAGHASHAVNDFRKLCAIESYAPTDNVSELTARTNDEGWETALHRLARGLAARSPTTPCSRSRSGAARASTTSRSTWSTRIELAREAGAAHLRRGRRPGGALARAGRRGDPHRPPAGASTRRWWSRSRRSSGTRSSRTPSWRRRRATGRRSARARREPPAGRLPRPRRRPQRAGARPGLRRSRSRRCGRRTCGCCPAPRRRAAALRECRVRARRESRISPPRPRARSSRRAARGGPARVRRAARRARASRSTAVYMCLHHPEGVVPELRGPCDCRKPAPGMLLAGRRASWASTSAARGWWATPTPTSRPDARPGCRTVLDRATRSSAHKRAPVSADPRRAARRTSRERCPCLIVGETLRDTLGRGVAIEISDADLRRRRRPRRDPGARRRSAHHRVHHEPDADVEGRSHRLRGLRAAPAGADNHVTRSPSRCSPTTPTRCAARRA